MTLSPAAAWPDIRIVEYSGADPSNPVDVTAAGTGNSATSTAGPATTTNPTDLIFGANMVGAFTKAAGSGFTQRINTSPDGDFVEDRMVTATGSYSATASLGTGAWVMQMVAFRTPSGGDTTPPTAPTNLTATVSGTQINLSWTASTDNVGVTGYKVERCQGSGCTTFAQIATPTATTYSDTGLAAGNYSYRVRATDAAGNLSAYSNTASGVIPDTTPPTAPSGLTATLSGSQVNLSWTASTDNVGVTGYLVERCQGSGCTTFAQIGTSTTTTYSDTGLSVGGYSYRVRATDAAGNLSTYSNVASATITDTTPPTAPTNLTATVSGTQINLSWTASTDNVGVTGYKVERCQGSGCTTFAQIATPTATTYSDTGLAAGTYSYRVRATDAAGNLSAYSNVASGVIPDTTPPTAPSGLTATVSGSQINLSWTASTDNVGVTGYLVERCQGTGCTTFAQIGTPTTTTYSDIGLSVGTYSYRVRATDAAGNLSTYSNVASATITDTTPPTAPTNLTAAVSGTQINLSWTASTDNVGVTGYKVERCQGSGCTTFAQIATPTGTTYSDTGLASGNYSYRVRAADAAGNLSGYSNVASGVIPDTTPPTAPTNLTATSAGINQINLSWTASTDNVGVTGYLVERCQGTGCTTFAQIATPAGTTYSDIGLTANTSYSYRVRATDAANNLSPYSNTATATTTAGPVPTAPTNLAISAGPGAIVDAVQSYINSASLTTHTTAAFDSTGGDVIVICASSHAGVTLTPSDSFGNTWISIAGPTSTTVGVDLRTQVWYALNPIVGPGHTVTMTLSTAQSLVISVLAVKGSNISSPIEAVSLIGSDNGTLTVNVVSPSITTTGINDLLIGFGKLSNGSAVFQAGSGFTQQAGASSAYLDAETGPAATPGTYSATFTLSQTSDWQSAVVAISNNPNQATLTWTASTETGGTISNYLVERCQGVGCSSFSQIASTAGTTFNDTGLTASTSYSYRVRAEDTTNTTGPYSNIATFSTPAPIPSAPGNLTAAIISGTQINLAWVASAETGGTISSYLVERCQGANCTNFAQIGTSPTTTYSDTTASGGNYSYRVRAMDAAGHLSPYSNLASGVIADTTPPTAPTNLTATASSATQISLSWTASTDNVGVTGYLVERCQGSGCTTFAQIATPTSTTYNDTGLTANTSYSYRVRATDAAGNLSTYSNVASATTQSTGSATITYIQSNYATPQTPQTTVNVTFTAAQAAGDLNVVAVGWNDSTAIVNSVTDKSGNVYTPAVGPTAISGALSQSIYYAKNILAAAAGANIVTITFSPAAAWPDIRIVEYKGADPGNPVDVTAAATGNSAASTAGPATTTNPTDLIFGANMVQSSTSGAGAGFTLRMNTSPDGDITEDEMVTASGSYSATAPIAAGAWIMQMVAFRTPVSGGDTTPPTAPANLTATASGSQINLSWTASSDPDSPNITYHVERCQGSGCSTFAQIATTTTTTYSDTGLTPTSYSYRVRALDPSGNGSPYSNVASATIASGLLSISPRTAELTFTRTQQFSTDNGSVTWSVDGTVGGSASSGTITAAGLYTPPSTVGTHAITVTTTDQSQSVSATAYITNYAGTFTFHNDTLRTGVNNNETVLTTANVNQAQFGKLFSYATDGFAYASPLYVANVNIPGQGFHNVVYVATEHDSVYGFDADGLGSSPLWHVSFLVNGATTVPCADTGECGDIPNEIGITSTPVIDPASGTLYVVAKTKEGTNYVQRLHALDITTGAEKFGGPVVLQATVPGAGDGTSTVTFNPLRENQRPGILLSNGVVYLAFGSHGDIPTWYGWILAYNATTLQQVLVFNSAPDATQGGIWQSGGGLATDASGNIFFTTGNGVFNVNTGGRDYGDSVMRISPSGTVVDYFTPHDQANMSNTNIELGSAGPVLLVDQTTGPFPHLLITAGKNGTIYVVNRDSMGHYNANNDNQIVQSLVNALLNSDADHGNYSSPVFFNGYVYFCAINDALKAFQLTNGLLSTSPTSHSAVMYPNRGGSFAISANGTSNAILWAMQDNSFNTPNNGVLRAYDATNLNNELYDTGQNASRDALDVANKFSIPLVANGKVYVVSQTQFIAYGLLP